jgi:hypothetical protein
MYTFVNFTSINHFNIFHKCKSFHFDIFHKNYNDKILKYIIFKL